MARRKLRGYLLMIRVVAAAVLLSACATPSVGPSQPWIAWDQIDGPLRPEVGQQTVSEAAGSVLKTVTFNVHYGKNVAAIAQAIRNSAELQQADVVFLQEIQSYPSEGSSRTQRLAEELGMNYAYAPAKSFDQDGETGTHGNAILSKLPLESVVVMELPRGKLVVNEERRIALAADIRLDATNTVHLINVHLDTRLNATERILQLRPAILGAPDRTIVGGDFNTNPMVWAFNMVPIVPLAVIPGSDQAPILDDYLRQIGFATPTASYGKTVDFPVLNARLDSIFVRGLSSANGGVLRTTSISDHWPVWLDIPVQP